MTMKDERYLAIRSAREFLRDLLDPSKTKRVPRAIRQRAYSVLKHFPGDYDMEKAAKSFKEVFKVVKEDK